MRRREPLAAVDEAALVPLTLDATEVAMSGGGCVAAPESAESQPATMNSGPKPKIVASVVGMPTASCVPGEAGPSW